MGSRLPHDERREQLVRAGLELLGRRPYDEVSIGEIAAAAGISKGLLYHYFPTKTDFVVAVLAASREELTERIDAGSSSDPAARLEASLDAFLAYAEEHAPGYLAVARARSGNDAGIRAALEQGRRERVRSLVGLAALIGGVHPSELDSPLLDAALDGWLHFTDGVVVRWLTGEPLARADVHLLLIVNFLGALESAGAADGRPAFARLRERSGALRARFTALRPSAA